MCPHGCYIDPEKRKCIACGRSLREIMDSLKVPEKDQQHTINWLIYQKYQ